MNENLGTCSKYHVDDYYNGEMRTLSAQAYSSELACLKPQCKIFPIGTGLQILLDCLRRYVDFSNVCELFRLTDTSWFVFFPGGISGLLNYYEAIYLSIEIDFSYFPPEMISQCNAEYTKCTLANFWEAIGSYNRYRSKFNIGLLIVTKHSTSSFVEHFSTRLVNDFNQRTQVICITIIPRRLRTWFNVYRRRNAL